MTSGLTSQPPNPQTKMILKGKDPVEIFVSPYTFWHVDPRSINNISPDKKSTSRGGAFMKVAIEWLFFI